MQIRSDLTPRALDRKVRRLFELSASKIRSLEASWSPARGSPVYTMGGRYTSRGWSEWTLGFQLGAPILQFDATGEMEFLDLGSKRTIAMMAPYVSQAGPHNHGFKTLSTYGNLLRLMNEGRIADNPWERNYYELALKISGAMHAACWSRTAEGGGYIYSFNGPHSLFVDTVRVLRILAVAHRLGHVLMSEGEQRISLLDRLVDHARTTAKYAVYYGEGRDNFDVRGRVAEESVFNPRDGQYRYPSSQQGYSPFTTWARALAWAVCGFAEQLEFAQLSGLPGDFVALLEMAARATCDFYIDNTPLDGIPYWDTGAPGLAQLGDWRSQAADPFNLYEAVDSSAAAIAAQGLLRLGHYLNDDRYWQAGLTVCATLFDEPYLSTATAHQGLILHSVCHRQNGRDCAPGESSMWGDYHAREVALYLLRVTENRPYLKFWA